MFNVSIFKPLLSGQFLLIFLFFSRISGHHWRKAVAKDWYANGVPLTLTGKLEMFQQSEYGITNVEVGFKGLIENSGYHVHIVSIFYMKLDRNHIL